MELTTDISDLHKYQASEKSKSPFVFISAVQMLVLFYSLN